MTSNFPSRRILRSKYRVLGLVGQGQFGKVYCAIHRKTGRLVALKALDHQRFPTHQFLRELRFLLSLRHNNIAGCQALEHTATGRYLVMDYCEGGTLRSLLEGEVRIGLAQSLKLVRDILLGLEHAHKRGVIHCDIKPENVLLRLNSSGWLAQITDFGIARLTQENKMGSGSTGSPAYMAPERFYGQYHANADLYAVGVILFESLTGHRPFSGTPMELMTAHLNRPPPLPDEIAPVLRTILERSLQKLPARRFQSATDMREALEQAARSLLPQLQASPAWFLLPPGTDLVPWDQVWERSIPTPVYHLVHVQEQAVVTAAGVTPGVQATPGARDSQELLPPLRVLYKAGGKRLHYTLHPQHLLQTEHPHLVRHKLAQEVQTLVSTPLGCFVVMASRLELWCLEQPSPHLSHPSQPTPHRAICLYDGTQPERMAVAPTGRWFVVTTGAGVSPGRDSSPVPGPETPSSPVSLSIHSIPPRPPSGPWLPSDRPPISLTIKSPNVSQVVILDQAHGFVLGQRDNKSYLEFFNRRGRWFGQLALELSLDRCVSTPNPYRLLAKDHHHHRSLLILDLKPYRLKRLPLPFSPDFFEATGWGYVIANRKGDILLLDHEHNRVGQLVVPQTSPDPLTVTTLVMVDDLTLLVATWAGTQGHLYGLDVRQLALDMIF
ncbi:serine/threonine-protein kinase [Prochlorothrix hollandica]|uniref:serine/threonine-protein kinase n=1 Tax=Prochlorothrix hollandica TaxID=1223 RepID=UPI00333FCAC1